MNSVWVVRDEYGMVRGGDIGQATAWNLVRLQSPRAEGTTDLLEWAKQREDGGWTCREYVPAEQYDATLKDKQRQIDHLVECLEEVVGHANDVLETFYLPRPPEPGSVQDAPPKEFVQ